MSWMWQDWSCEKGVWVIIFTDTIRTVEDTPITMKEQYELYYLENATLPRTLTKSTYNSANGN